MDRLNTAYYVMLASAFATLPAAAAAVHESSDHCEIFMGPSLIKEAEQQGFGLGMFTGIDIARGDDVDLDEVLLPLYDSATIDRNHPPLREYLWPGAILPEIPLVGSSNRNALWSSPGLASIAPCTSSNFNLVLSGSGIFAGVSRHNLVEDEDTPLRTSPAAGSYSYHHSLSYTAVRDIKSGEELVVECNDEAFDTTHHTSISRFNSSDSSFMCVDNVKSGPSLATGGKGLFARQPVYKGDTIISSPLVPIHRKEMFGDGTGATAPTGFNSYQLMLNYALGHADSDLLLFPYGPLVGYINHPPPGKKANAIIKWHSAEEIVSRRQQYHHPELFDLSANDVSETHGKGLMIDVVALDKNIGIGEEIYIDYGEAWAKAWENHVKRWKAPTASPYVSADKWFHLHDDGIVKTVEELQNNPYPDNLQTICYYDNDAHLLRVDEENHTVYTRWQDEEDEESPHECLRPCKILERYPDADDGELLYKAEMLNFEGASRLPFCLLEGGRHISRDLTYDGILLVDKAYSSDMFLEQAFRHEIGVPKDFFPRRWLRQKVRRRPSTSYDAGSEFKRKRIGEIVSKKMLLKEEKMKMESARIDL